MISLRRPEHETRIEIMPLIDVIFLLLTFFIYAMVLMIRAELLPLQLESFASGEPARPAPTVTISILRDGSVHFNRETIGIEEIPDFVAAALEVDPDTRLFLALERGEGTVDRGPLMQAIIDKLSGHGVQINLVGQP